MKNCCQIDVTLIFVLLLGAQIILSMKIIGVAFDLSNGVMLEFPSVFAYFGYNFCVGTVIFGPWISFTEYKHILSQHKRPMVRNLHILLQHLFYVNI